jgi:hypothetical protein
MLKFVCRFPMGKSVFNRIRLKHETNHFEKIDKMCTNKKKM